MILMLLAVVGGFCILQEHRNYRRRQENRQDILTAIAEARNRRGKTNP